jgi:hypothetical protein
MLAILPHLDDFGPLIPIAQVVLFHTAFPQQYEKYEGFDPRILLQDAQ